MLHKDTLIFLTELKENNHKIWFDENRKRYEAIRKEWVCFIGKLIEAIGEFDEEVVGIEPAKTLFRINRDIRFSKDKSPYKINIGAHIAGRNSKEVGQVGYYLHIEPGGSFLGGGIYIPEPETLKKIRNYIDTEGEDLMKVTTDPLFVKIFGQLKGDKLKSTPKGYPKEHIFSDFLSMKDWYVLHLLPEKTLFSDALLSYTKDIFMAQYPLIQFLRKAIRSE